MTDTELESMSVKDLRDLKQRVEDAIRSQIARSRQLGPGAGPAVVGRSDPEPIDLERERDAWQARRR